MPPNTKTRSSKSRSRGFRAQATGRPARSSRVIGFLDDPNVETNVIIKKFGLPTAFPKEVEEEAAQLPDALTRAGSSSDATTSGSATPSRSIPRRPATSMMPIDVEVLPDGTFQLGVHIADVSHFVQPDSAMDIEARCRGTSVYFPDRVLPMLPEKVSNHLCSLNPRVGPAGVERDDAPLPQTARSCDYSFHKSIIHSKERMTYDDVQKIIDGDRALERRNTRTSCRRFGRSTRLARDSPASAGSERGAIDFDLPEPMLTYDEEGDVTGIVKSVRHFSHRIVEEFMILANEVVAQASGRAARFRRSIAFMRSPIRRRWRISRKSWRASG